MPKKTPAARKVRKTNVGLPEAARSQLVTLLNARLADTVDYALQLKQAHWNVKGLQFVALHEMFDAQHAEAMIFADSLAERLVQLGGQAYGTLQAASSATQLAAYPLEATEARDHLAALMKRLSTLANGVREAIDRSAELGDADTADLFTEVSRGLDKQLWYLEAHLGK